MTYSIPLASNLGKETQGESMSSSYIGQKMFFPHSRAHEILAVNGTHALIFVGWYKKVPLTDIEPDPGEQRDRRPYLTTRDTYDLLYTGSCKDVSELDGTSISEFPSFFERPAVSSPDPTRAMQAT